MARNGNFYGDDGNNVDFSQRHAGSMGSDDAESILKSLRQARPDLSIWKDPVMSKRLSDLLADSQAGFDTTPQEDSLLRQSYPEADEYTEQAERIVRSMERNSQFAIPKDPGMRREWVEDQAERLRGGKGNRMPAQPEEPEEEPFSSEKFWNSDEPKKVMPRKL